jgi:hypothetical protein
MTAIPLGRPLCIVDGKLALAPSYQEPSDSPESPEVRTTAKKVIEVILCILALIPGISTVVFWPITTICIVGAFQYAEKKEDTSTVWQAAALAFIVGIPLIGNGFALYRLARGKTI